MWTHASVHDAVANHFRIAARSSIGSTFSGVSWSLRISVSISSSTVAALRTLRSNWESCRSPSGIAAPFVLVVQIVDPVVEVVGVLRLVVLALLNLLQGDLVRGHRLAVRHDEAHGLVVDVLRGVLGLQENVAVEHGLLDHRLLLLEHRELLRDALLLVVPLA